MAHTEADQNQSRMNATTIGTSEFLTEGIKGFDTNLVKVMEKIEIKLRQGLEKYAELIQVHGHDKRFMAMLRGRHKEIELKRKDERQAAGKLREQKLIEERNERNLLKMKLKEHVKANIYKR